MIRDGLVYLMMLCVAGAVIASEAKLLGSHGDAALDLAGVVVLAVLE
jgi:hypothetical protein